MYSDNKVSVLVVDDSDDFSELFANILSMRGYSVRTASNGEDALAMIEEVKPHCVILDVHMPRLDVHQFSRQVREKYGDDIVLIAMSGFAASEPSVKGTFEIVDHYLQKPFDWSELDKFLPRLT